MGSFYEKAILDDQLAPFFVNELGDDLKDEEWVDHIDLLADFWLAKLEGERTYIGNFVGAHIKLPHIKREVFARWLELFSETADEIYEPELATRFKKKGQELAKQFMKASIKI
jgi:hemoglobin